MLYFSTPRLTIRPLQLADKDFYCSLYCDQQVMKYIATPMTTTQAERAFKLALKLTEQAHSYYSIFVLKETASNNLVGIAGLTAEQAKLHRQPWFQAKTLEIGIMFLPQFYNQGYGRESISHLVKCALPELMTRLQQEARVGVKTVYAKTNVNNSKSCKLFEQVGFKRKNSSTDPDIVDFYYQLP